MKKWVFKLEDSILIKCWGCEEILNVKSVYYADGFCPICRIEIDTEEDPYQPELSSAEDE